MMMQKYENETVEYFNFFSQQRETYSAPPATGVTAVEIWFLLDGLKSRQTGQTPEESNRKRGLENVLMEIR